MKHARKNPGRDLLDGEKFEKRRTINRPDRATNGEVPGDSHVESLISRPAEQKRPSYDFAEQTPVKMVGPLAGLRDCSRATAVIRLDYANSRWRIFHGRANYRGIAETEKERERESAHCVMLSSTITGSSPRLGALLQSSTIEPQLLRLPDQPRLFLHAWDARELN